MKQRRDRRDRRNKRNRDRDFHREPKQVKKRNKISDHFSRKDFYCKSGLDTNNNSFRISAGLIGALEMLRTAVGTRINIIKGFECTESAEKKGKVRRNYHVQGLAANISADELSLETLFQAAEQIPEIMGIGLNLDENYVHIRTNKSDTRDMWVIIKNEEYELDEARYKTYIGDVATPLPQKQEKQDRKEKETKPATNDD